MNIGVVILIILIVPMFFQVIRMGTKQKQMHDELIQRVDRLEEMLKGK